jgi:hypothetical protein
MAGETVDSAAVAAGAAAGCARAVVLVSVATATARSGPATLSDLAIMSACFLDPGTG